MTTPALRQAWQEWCAFADGLDLSGGASDCAALHARLFRFNGRHARGAGHLRDTRERLRAGLGPWLDPASGSGADDLEQLRQVAAACEPAWRALIGSGKGRTDWNEVERLALATGLSWPEEPFWASPLFVEGKRFAPLTALRGRNRTEAVALLGRLLDIVNHAHGGPLWRCLIGSLALRR